MENYIDEKTNLLGQPFGQPFGHKIEELKNDIHWRDVKICGCTVFCIIMLLVIINSINIASIVITAVTNNTEVMVILLG